MAFDFSKYTGDASGAIPSPSIAQYTPGYSTAPDTPIDPAIASQLFNYVGKSDADLATSDQDVKQKLIDAGLIKSITEGAGGEGGDVGQTFYELGDHAPSNFSGNISHTDHTPELQRIIGADNTKLLNPQAVYKDSEFGNVTTQGNKDQRDGGWDTFWKVAPLIPAAFAAIMSGGAMAPLLAEMPEAGGATAGGMIGGQTLSDIGGGAIAQGGSATAGGALSDLPASVAKAFPDVVKNSISGLNSNNGKYNPLSALTSMFGGAIPPWLMPVVSASLGAAQGKGFDFTKFISPAVGAISKGLG